MTITKRLPFLFIALNISLLLGCAHTQSHEPLDAIVSGIAEPDLLGKRSYVLLPGQNLDQFSQEKMKDFTVHMHRVLAQQGFIRAAGYDSAEILLFYSFRIEEPLVFNYGFSVPGKRWTGVGSPQSTLALAEDNGGIGSSRLEYLHPYSLEARLRQTAGKKSLHDGLLSLRAYDYTAYRTEKKLRPVWTATARCLGPADNPQAVFLALMEQAELYLAKYVSGGQAELSSKFKR